MSELINPDLIREVAQRIHREKSVVCEVYDAGFVIQHSRNRKRCTFVGIREEADRYVVAKMWKKSETIGRSEPRIQTRKNDYVQCELYRMELDTPTNDDETVEAIADKIDNGEYIEHIDTGYINGYRLTALRDVLEETFRWYSA